jgi:hypothetical protein
MFCEIASSLVVHFLHTPITNEAINKYKIFTSEVNVKFLQFNNECFVYLLLTFNLN